MSTFTYEYSSTGYRILCDGVCIGGASTKGRGEHTGTRRSWQAHRKNIDMHRETAERICTELRTGGGPAFMWKAIAEGSISPEAFDDVEVEEVIPAREAYTKRVRKTKPSYVKPTP